MRRLVQSLAETGMDVRVFGTQDEFKPTLLQRAILAGLLRR